MISLHLASSNQGGSEFDRGIRVVSIDGAEKVNAITDRFFLDWLYGYELSLEPAQMMKCIALAGQIKIIDVTRVKGMDTKRVLIDELMKKLQG